LGASYSLSCVYALKGVGILLAFLIDHSQLEVSMEQSRYRIIHSLAYFSPCAVSDTTAPALPLCFLCVLHLLTFPPGWTALWQSHFIFVQVGIYIHTYIHKSNMLTSPPCIFLPLNLYHPGIGDLNLPVLHSALVAGVCFGVVIFILKRVRQDLVDLHMCHETRAMHGQQMLIMFPPL
jgi:hypothetical protein